MNVENEINKHEPITIDDISSVSFSFDFEEWRCSEPTVILVLCISEKTNKT